jgi:hypothetical protein
MSGAAVTFDTLKFANRLKAAGIKPLHAEAEAEALSDVFAANLKELATLDDLKQMESRLDAKLAEMKFDILRWVIGIALVQTGLLVGVIVKFV